MADISGWNPADYGLKPCPFCGNGPTEIVIDQRHTSIYSSDLKMVYSRISCSFCNLTVKEDVGSRDAKEIWNRRAVTKNGQNETTATDVEPVRHGYWINTHDRFVKCSLCGKSVQTNWRGFYCQNCGAKMNGGVNENP